MDLIGAGILGGFLASVVTGLMLKFYLPGYLGEKGKNLATKEDIEHITEKIESVKTQYALLVEATKVENQLRVAALDKRLEKAQEAFALWRKLYKSTNSENWIDVVMECQTWWEQNCLYLEPAAREAFSAAYTASNLHQDLFRNRVEARLITENFAKITSAGEILVKSVSLPGLTKADRAEIAEATTPPAAPTDR